MAQLITLRDVGVEVVLAVELAVVGNGAAHGKAHAQYLPHRLFVDDGQGPGMPHTDRADIDVRARLVRVVFGRTKHLGLCFELGMDLHADGGDVVHDWDATCFWINWI